MQNEKNLKPESGLNTSKLKVLLILAVTFVLSRWYFYWLGVRFDISPLDEFWQYLEPEVLRQRLFPSLWNLHAQPPGFNLFLGLVLNICNSRYDICFHLAYLLIGFGLYLGLYQCLRLLSFRKATSILLATAYIVSPNAILFENWLFYTYPVQLILVLTALFLLRYEKEHRLTDAFGFIAALVVLVFTRSMFHLFYLLIASGFVLVPKSSNRRIISVAVVVAVSLLLGLYLKNYLVFDFFGSSSWIGMNSAKVTMYAVGRKNCHELAQKGRLPKIAKVDPFQPLEHYPSSYRSIPPQEAKQQPELYLEKKRNGEPNLNHIDYVAISWEYQRVSLALIRQYPQFVLAKIWDCWLKYCEPCWDSVFQRDQACVLSWYIALLSTMRSRAWVNAEPYRAALFGVMGESQWIALTDLVLIILLFLFAFHAIKRVWSAYRGKCPIPLGHLFMVFTIAYVAVVGNTFEWGENNRFRVMTDPLFFILTVFLVKKSWQTIRFYVFHGVEVD